MYSNKKDLKELMEVIDETYREQKIGYRETIKERRKIKAQMIACDLVDLAYSPKMKYCVAATAVAIGLVIGGNYLINDYKAGKNNLETTIEQSYTP